MRCSPHVHGVAYDILAHLTSGIDKLLNKHHLKTIVIEGEECPNMDLRSEQEIQNIDYLLCALVEIGAMSYLRSERILNSYLGKNHLFDCSNPRRFSLMSLLQKGILKASENKTLTYPTNFDTMNIGNYYKDVYYNDQRPLERMIKIFDNLYFLMNLEVYSAVTALKEFQGEKN